MLYAAYGSNLHPERLRLRLPESRFLGTAEISGRSLYFHKRSRDGSGKCNIVPGNGRIYIAIYEITSYERMVLDRIEGMGLGYNTETLMVPDFGYCYTYVAAPTHIDSRLRPYSWYKDLVLLGCEALQFPDAYVATIRSLSALDDPDRVRHASNMKICDSARSTAIRPISPTYP